MECDAVETLAATAMDEVQVKDYERKIQYARLLENITAQGNTQTRFPAHMISVRVVYKRFY